MKAFLLAGIQKKMKFHKSLSAEQKQQLHVLKYDMKRALLPLKARYKAEKMILAALMMDLNVTLPALTQQIDKVIAAKDAYVAAKIEFFLKKHKILTAEQRVKYNMMKLMKKKMAKKVAKRGKMMFRLFWTTVEVKAAHIKGFMKAGKWLGGEMVPADGTQLADNDGAQNNDADQNEPVVSQEPTASQDGEPAPVNPTAPGDEPQDDDNDDNDDNQSNDNNQSNDDNQNNND